MGENRKLERGRNFFKKNAVSEFIATNIFLFEIIVTSKLWSHVLRFTFFSAKQFNCISFTSSTIYIIYHLMYIIKVLTLNVFQLSTQKTTYSSYTIHTTLISQKALSFMCYLWTFGLPTFSAFNSVVIHITLRVICLCRTQHTYRFIILYMWTPKREHNFVINYKCTLDFIKIKYLQWRKSFSWFQCRNTQFNLFLRAVVLTAL